MCSKKEEISRKLGKEGFVIVSCKSALTSYTWYLNETSSFSFLSHTQRMEEEKERKRRARNTKREQQCNTFLHEILTFIDFFLFLPNFRVSLNISAAFSKNAALELINQRECICFPVLSVKKIWRGNENKLKLVWNIHFHPFSLSLSFSGLSVSPFFLLLNSSWHSRHF